VASIKLYSWNTNGLRAVVRKGLFEPFLAGHSPDILCLQETKAGRDKVEVDLPGYIEYWHSAEKPGYSGTAIFSKLQPIAVAYGLGEIEKKYDLADKYGDTTREGRVITAEFDKFYLVSVYTPNAKDDLTRIPLRTRWDQAFYEYVKTLEKSKPVIFTGDLNVAHTPDDLARPKENEGKKGFTKEERKGFQRYVDNGYLDTFRIFTQDGGHYTWWTHWANARARNVGWRIDYFMVSDALKPNIKSAAIHADVMGSDHCPISLELTLPTSASLL